MTEHKGLVGKPLVLSVSRKQLYEKCPLSYKRRYIDNLWQKPAAWLVQGLAVHEAAEEHQKGLTDRDEVVQACEVAYDKHGSRLIRETPDLKYWFWSGPYNGEADLERRYDIARAMIVKYMDWVENHPEEKVWFTSPNFDPNCSHDDCDCVAGVDAIELGFEIDLEGTKVRGFIDLVIEDEHGLIVRDIKTGNKPGDEFQLKTYAVALKLAYGVDVRRGDFWMGKTGKPTLPIYFDEELMYTEIRDTFKELEENILAGEATLEEMRLRGEDTSGATPWFEPTPGEHCRFCSVSYDCEFKL